MNFRKGGREMKQLVLITMVLLLSSSTALAQDFCKGDFIYDGDVDGEDVTEFLSHFGRGQYDRPCPPDGPAPVPRTGQNNAYGVPGSDGDLLRGIEWPNPRFTDNGDGTVTDNLTGLIWLKNATCFGDRNWNQAITDCNGLADGDNLCNSGTFSLTDGSIVGDWRLPNLRELFSLLDHKYYEPALPNTEGTGQWSYGDPFINLPEVCDYWSSTNRPYYIDNAWYISMGYGFVSNYHMAGSVFKVWPVRGGH
jgi:hypothetical protein